MIILGNMEVISADFGNTGNQNIKSKELVYHPYCFISTWFDKARAGIKLRLVGLKFNPHKQLNSFLGQWMANEAHCSSTVQKGLRVWLRFLWCLRSNLSPLLNAGLSASMVQACRLGLYRPRFKSGQPHSHSGSERA